MDKEKIISYVMETPGNTNPNVLRSLLDDDGSSLPPVTSEEDGNVVLVNNGEYQLWKIGDIDRPDAVVLECSISNGEITTSTTVNYDNFIIAVQNGAPVVCDFTNDDAFASVMKIIGTDNSGVLLFKGDYCSLRQDSITRKFYLAIGKNDDVTNIAFVWESNKFIVTLTPTAPDYSGTMDKTVAEINAAYEAGQEIVFRTMMSETTYMDVDCTARWFHDTTYPSFNGFILNSDSDVFLFAFTSATNDGTKQTYGTVVYPLTRAS